MTRTAADVLTIMRRATGRKNENDPDASDAVFLRYLNDFITLTMSDDIRLFENFGTLSFTIDETITSGVYTFNDVGASTDFVSLSHECYASLEDPVDNSVSWNRIQIFQDPGEFFSRWGINNDDILIPGFPTEMLFYGNEFTFRTIPNVSYIIKIYGYKKNEELPDNNEPIPFDRWLRYLAYGASMNYARDFRFAPEIKSEIKRDFAHEKTLMLTHAHNQIKMSRSQPRF